MCSSSQSLPYSSSPDSVASRMTLTKGRKDRNCIHGKTMRRSWNILKCLALLSLIGCLGVLRLHVHVELEFAGIPSHFFTPRKNLLLVPSVADVKDSVVVNGDADQQGSKQKVRFNDTLRYRPGQTLFYNERALGRDRQLYMIKDKKVYPMVKDLILEANKAYKAGPWSVMDKPNSTVAPSGDKHDFYSLSPHSSSIEKSSDAYDASRLQYLQGNTTILCLAYALTKSDRYAVNAVEKIRMWFLHPLTRMNPHMKYANMIKPGQDDTSTTNSSSSSKIDMVMRDFQLWIMLDSARLLQGFLTPLHVAKLRSWLTEYLTWLESTVSTGSAHSKLTLSSAPFFDIERISIAAYLNDTIEVDTYAKEANSRLASLINKDGKMSFESTDDEGCEYQLQRKLQGWSTLSQIISSLDQDLNLWNSHRTNGVSLLCRASEYAIPFYGRRSEQCNKGASPLYEVTVESWWPLMYESQLYCPELRGKAIHVPSWFAESKGLKALPPQSIYDMPSLHDPQYGIPPFWHLGKDFPK